MNTLFYKVSLYLHSYNRYILLAALIAVVLVSLFKFIGKKSYGVGDNSLSLILMISSHIQLLLGVGLYLISPMVIFTKEAIKLPAFRYWTAEHISMMLPAIILISIGRVLTKKSARKVAGKPHSPHLLAFLINGIALVLIAISLMQKLRLSV